MTDLETYPERVQVSEGARAEIAQRLLQQNLRLMVEHDTLQPLAVTWPTGGTPSALRKLERSSFRKECL